MHIDVGSGDGRGPYRWARREAGRLFIAADANPDVLRDTAAKAGRKPARGGLPNLLCIAEPLHALAAELPAAADRVTVILPWGDLLRAAAAPAPGALQALRALCLPSATIEIVCSYDHERDAGETGPLGPAGLDAAHVRGVLPAAYAAAGFSMLSVEMIDSRELAQCETTWAKRLAFGRRREVWRIRAGVKR